MITELLIKTEQNVIGLASDIVYMQEPYWCNASAHQLKLSYMGPRLYYPYDPPCPPRPCILFFCGGAFQKQDRNVWIPELAYFSKNGISVITIDYDTFAFTRYPEQLNQAHTAINFILSNSSRFNIDPNKIITMGESAGGQLACWTALTHSPYCKNFKAKGCVALYPVCDINAFPKPDTLRIYTDNFPDTCELVTSDAPPFLLFHGTKDSQVPHTESVRLHNALKKNNVQCMLYLLKDADHSGPEFMTDEITSKILEFIHTIL